jgi:hypothetical protein
MPLRASVSYGLASARGTRRFSKNLSKVAPVALRLAISKYVSQREPSYLIPKVAPVALRLAISKYVSQREPSYLNPERSTVSM